VRSLMRATFCHFDIVEKSLTAAAGYARDQARCPFFGCANKANRKPVYFGEG
jgi:hypothetical protein